MRFKPKVIITGERDCPCTLSLNGITKEVDQSVLYLVDAIQNGTYRNEDLKDIIINKEQSDDVLAGFTLAQFILDYQYYIEENEHLTIV